jgi:hypothetical protein
LYPGQPFDAARAQVREPAATVTASVTSITGIMLESFQYVNLEANAVTSLGVICLDQDVPAVAHKIRYERVNLHPVVRLPFAERGKESFSRSEVLLVMMAVPNFVFAHGPPKSTNVGTTEVQDIAVYRLLI